MNHLAIFVRALDKARLFYGEILGLTEINRPSFFIQGIWYDLGTCELHLMLHEAAIIPTPHPLAATVQPHFSLLTQKNTVGTIVERASQHGLALIAEPTKSSTGLVQLFLYDFDKNMIELNYKDD